MPNALATVIAKVIVGAIAGATGVAIGSVAAGVVVSVYAASIIASLAIISAVAKSFQPDMPSDNADMKRDIVLRGGTEARKIVYGEGVVGGVLVYSNITGPENAYLVTGVAHAGHQVYNMTDVYFDDDVIAQAEIGNSAGAAGTLSTYDNGWTTGTTGPHTGQNALVSGKYYKAGDTWVLLDRYTGLETQTASGFLTQFSDFDASDRGRGLCYSVYHLVLNEQSEKVWESGSPRNYKSKIQGKIVYNPALDVTAGAWIIANGFDPYSVYTDVYKAYSTNPVLCAIDYMIDNQNGMAISPAKIDWDEVVSEAAFCDKPVANSVTGNRESRFTCNGVLSTFDTHKVNLMRLMSACNGNMAYKNGKWFIKAGRFSQGNSGVTNGSFASGNTGWTKFGTGTAAESSGRMECVATSGNKVGRYQQLTGLTAGFLYTVSGLAENTDGVTGAIGEINVTTAAGDTGTVLGGASFGVLAADGNHEFEFIATGTTAYLNLFVNAPVNGTVYFDNVEAYSVATKTLTADWLRDTIGVQTSLTKQERFNETKAFYFSSAETYKQVQSLEVYSAVNLSRDNQEVLTRELNLPMTNAEDEAQRIQYKLLKMNERQVRLSAPCNYLALDLAVNDRVMVTIEELGYTQKVFLVEGWTLVDAQGGVDLVLIEDDADYWRDPDTNDYATRTATGVLVPATPEVPPPTSVTLTARTGLPDMIVSWNDPEPSTYYDMAQVYRATTNSFGAATALVDIRTNTYTDTTATAGVNYYYWVRSRKGGEFSTEVATTPTNSTAAAINAATATNVQWSGVLDGAGTIPADNATVGGRLGTDVKDEGGVVIGNIDALNVNVISLGISGVNYNAFVDIARDDDTPAGYYIANQVGTPAVRTDLLGYEDSTHARMKIFAGSERPELVTAAVYCDRGSRYFLRFSAQASASSVWEFNCYADERADLGDGILASVDGTPAGNESTVTGDSGSFVNTVSGGSALFSTSRTTSSVIEFNFPWKTGGADDQVNWLTFSIRRTSGSADASLLIDRFLVYKKASGAFIQADGGATSGGV